jgi:hypothetical protein
MEKYLAFYEAEPYTGFQEWMSRRYFFVFFAFKPQLRV